MCSISPCSMSCVGVSVCEQPIVLKTARWFEYSRGTPLANNLTGCNTISKVEVSFSGKRWPVGSVSVIILVIAVS